MSPTFEKPVYMRFPSCARISSALNFSSPASGQSMSDDRMLTTTVRVLTACARRFNLVTESHNKEAFRRGRVLYQVNTAGVTTDSVSCEVPGCRLKEWRPLCPVLLVSWHFAPVVPTARCSGSCIFLWRVLEVKLVGRGMQTFAPFASVSTRHTMFSTDRRSR